MKEITIIIRYGSEKHQIPTQDDIILEDLLQQFSDRMSLDKTAGWVVSKEGQETALDLSRSLADNGVVDGDILDLALPGKGGCVLPRKTG